MLRINSIGLLKILNYQKSKSSHQFVKKLNRKLSSSDYKASSKSNYRILTKEEELEKKFEQLSEDNTPSSEEQNEGYFFGAFQSSKSLSPELIDIYKSLHGDFLWADPVQGVKNIIETSKLALLFYDQKYVDQRIKTLGFDLGAAYFIIFRRGKVKFKGIEDWVTVDPKTDKPSIFLPNEYSPQFMVEEIDLSNLPIIYDGLLSLENLCQLRAANFSNCPNFNDWCINRLCDQNYLKLEHLDISYCPEVTENGLTQIYKLRSLKTLNIEGLTNVDHLQLVCLMLQDCLPNLEIKGISYGE